MSALDTAVVLALAPDPASAKAGQGLAAARHWKEVGRNEDAARPLPSDPNTPQDAVPNFVEQYACVLKIQAIAGTRFTVSTAAPWGNGGNTQCDDVVTKDPKMLYRFASRVSANQQWYWMKAR